LEIGDRLLQEPGLLSHDGTPGGAHAADSLKLLSGQDQATFYALSQNSRYGGEKTVQGIFATNAIAGTVFPTMARFNHSCDPNAGFKWNANLNMITIHARKRIRVGDECTVCYGFAGADLQARSQRSTHLKSLFGFQVRTHRTGSKQRTLLRCPLLYVAQQLAFGSRFASLCLTCTLMNDSARAPSAR
jgi:hypothetical protein